MSQLLLKKHHLRTTFTLAGHDPAGVADWLDRDGIAVGVPGFPWVVVG